VHPLFEFTNDITQLSSDYFGALFVVFAEVIKNISLGRVSEEYKIANVAVFLASDESSGMTGL